MMPQFDFTGAAVVTSLAEGINAVQLTLKLANGAGWPDGPGSKVFTATLGDIAVGQAQEKVLCESRSGVDVVILQRGYDDTPAQEWGQNTLIRHTISGVFATESTDHVHDDTRHDHGQYLRPVDHAAVGHDASMLLPDSVGNSELQDSAVDTANVLDGAIIGPKLGAAAVTPDKVADATIQLITPPGLIVPYGGLAAPSGWLLCDGAAVSRVTFAALFAALGIAYGPGDGTTTFNLPNLQQRFPLGKAAGAGTGDALGETGGAIDHTHDLSDGRARVTLSGASPEIFVNRGVTSTWTPDIAGTANPPPAGADQATGARLEGNTSAVNPPFQVVQFIVKT